MSLVGRTFRAEELVSTDYSVASAKASLLGTVSMSLTVSEEEQNIIEVPNADHVQTTWATWVGNINSILSVFPESYYELLANAIEIIFIADPDTITINAESATLSELETWLETNMTEVLPTYAITTSVVGKGTFTSNVQTAEAGDTVTLTVSPGFAYTFSNYVTSPSVTITNNQFTMPAAAVSITAVFTADEIETLTDTSGVTHVFRDDRLPSATVSDKDKFLKGDGTWSDVDALPPITPSDEGKVMEVVGGQWSVATLPDALPSVTSSDNGKFLRVVNGEWAVESIARASEVSF